MKLTISWSVQSGVGVYQSPKSADVKASRFSDEVFIYLEDFDAVFIKNIKINEYKNSTKTLEAGKL